VAQDESLSAPPVPVAARGQADSGIMVLSSTCKVLYANKAARHFLRQLNRRENGHSTDGAFPVAVAGLLDEILKWLESRNAHRDQDQLEGRRLVLGQPQPLLLQVFGIPNRLDIWRSRIVLTIQETPQTGDS
jgi:hypothetical protein